MNNVFVYLVIIFQGSYVNNDKIVGKVTATDSDSDSDNSPFGQVVYNFINQSSTYTRTNVAMWYTGG